MLASEHVATELAIEMQVPKSRILDSMGLIHVLNEPCCVFLQANFDRAEPFDKTPAHDRMTLEMDAPRLSRQRTVLISNRITDDWIRCWSDEENRVYRIRMDDARNAAESRGWTVERFYNTSLFFVRDDGSVAMPRQQALYYVATDNSKCGFVGYEVTNPTHESKDVPDSFLNFVRGYFITAWALLNSGDAVIEKRPAGRRSVKVKGRKVKRPGSPAHVVVNPPIQFNPPEHIETFNPWGSGE